MYTVNVIFGGEDAADQLIIPGDAVTTAKLLGLMYIGLPLLLHLYKEAKTRMDIAGHCNFYLQTSLMRKYMNFNDDSRAAVSLDAVSEGCDRASAGCLKQPGQRVVHARDTRSG